MDRRPPGPSAAGRWLAIMVVAAALVFGVTACSNDDDDPKGPTATVGSSPPTTEAPTSTTTIDDVKAEVEAAYLEAEVAYYHLGVDPSQGLEILEDTRVGRSLRDVRKGVSQFREDGFTVEYRNGFPKASISDVAVDGETAVIRSCVVDDGLVRRISDGSVFNDDVTARFYSVRLVVVDGDGWKVEHEEVLNEAKGERCVERG